MAKTKRPFGLAGGPAIAALVLPAVLVGCSTQTMSINDSSAPGGAVRATIRGAQGDSSRRLGAGVEFGYEAYRAKGTQQLQAGETLQFQGTTYTGPQEMRHDAQLSQIYVAYNHRIGIGRYVELEPYVGVLHLQTKVRTFGTTAGVGLVSMNEGQSGVTAGLTPRVRFNERLAVELRYNILHTRLRAFGTAYEAVAVLSPAEHVALRLGWGLRTHIVEDRSGVSSKLSVHSRGPVATLQFDF